MKLSILIPSLTDRVHQLKPLVTVLEVQAKGLPVEIITWVDNKEKSTGAKRNDLLNLAKGEYVAFFDDDDKPANDYVTSILNALEGNPDCVGFKGWYYHRRKKYEWIISNALPYVDAIIDKKTVYLRHTNHLAPIRREIAAQIGYPDQYREEDHQYAVKLRESGLIRTEAFINKHLYHYIK